MESQGGGRPKYWSDLVVAPETMAGLRQWQFEERTWHEVSGVFAYM